MRQAPARQSKGAPHSRGFTSRMEATLSRKGMHNAASSSRVTQPMIGCDDAEDIESGAEDTTSVGGHSVASHAPSLHPSVMSSYSAGCSEITVGAGDETGYWDYQHRDVTMKDLGHTCRECKKPFRKLGEPLTERRGARTSMRYHADCFSGYADPRSQASSSMHTGGLAGTQMRAAPAQKAGSKMRTGKHFESSSDRGSGGKIAAFLGGQSNSFGSKSSRGTPYSVSHQPSREGLSVQQLAAHNKRLQEETISETDEAK